MNFSYQPHEDLEEALRPAWKEHLEQQHGDLSGLIDEINENSQFSRSWAIVRRAALHDSRRTDRAEIEAAVQEIE